MGLPNIMAFVAAIPIAEKAHFELFVFVLTAIALFLEKSKISEILRWSEDESFDLFLIWVHFELTFEGVLISAQVLIDFVIELIEFV